MERNAMTTPRGSQWHLTPPLRLAALALALAGLSFLVDGWLVIVLWLAALVLLVLAALKFSKVWRRGS
jgi:energy-coupling factor transporter transmembrane protein EcfT